MCQEVGLDRHSGALSLPDGFAQAHGVPVNDDGGQEIEPRHAVVLAFAGAVADFALASDAQRVLQGVMGLSFVQPDVGASAHVRVEHPFDHEERALHAADFAQRRGEVVLARIGVARWWNEMGKRRYPEACELFITADAGGSNGYRSRAWKHRLQKFADEAGMDIHVSHFPPGTSKWNMIEHRLFCHITQNWRGKPLRTFETIIDLIGRTRTPAGLWVKAKLDKRKYPTGEVTTNAEMDALSLHRNEFHGDWNYKLRPR